MGSGERVTEGNSEELQNHCREKLEAYKVPRFIEFRVLIGAGDGTRTRDSLLGRQELYH